METLAFLGIPRNFAMGVQILFLLVCGALGWRLIWAILVTPRLDRLPRRAEAPERTEEEPRVRVLIREPAPEVQCIEVIDTREALPRGHDDVITPRPVLPSGERRLVRRASR